MPDTEDCFPVMSATADYRNHEQDVLPDFYPQISQILGSDHEAFASPRCYFFKFFGGSSRMNDQETSAVWPLS